MSKERNISKEVIINKNELKVDLELESDYMILCGICMYYSKEKECIIGLSCAKICIFKDYQKIKQISTDCYGNYYTTLPRTKEYVICICKQCQKQKKNIICNNSHFCMKHFVFNDQNDIWNSQNGLPFIKCIERWKKYEWKR